MDQDFGKNINSKTNNIITSVHMYVVANNNSADYTLLRHPVAMQICNL